MIVSNRIGMHQYEGNRLESAQFHQSHQGPRNESWIQTK